MPKVRAELCQNFGITQFSLRKTNTLLCVRN